MKRDSDATSPLSTASSLWAEAPRRWGHSLHSLCSYMAMFPPAIPNVFIRWLSQPGDLVYDPFSGRGTTALEACLLQRQSCASDANPLACVLTGAKIDPPSSRALGVRLLQLRKSVEQWPTGDEPVDIRMLFSERTLGELLWLRAQLNPNDRTDRYMLAALLGILHANADSSGRPRGLTISMPNTFSMSPNYIRRFKAERHLVAPEVGVLDVLAERLQKFPPPSRDFMRGRMWQQNSSEPVRQILPRSVKLVFTSPPYLHVMLYGKLNWIRLWLLGADRRVVDAELFTSRSVDKYLDFMTTTARQLEEVLRPDGHICLVIGDVRRKNGTVNLAQLVADHLAAHLTDVRVQGIVTDELPTEHKVSRIWGSTRGHATKTDRIIVLSGRKIRRLPRAPIVSWQ